MTYTRHPGLEPGSSIYGSKFSKSGSMAKNWVRSASLKKSMTALELGTGTK
jgi:hypothetical protein